MNAPGPGFARSRGFALGLCLATLALYALAGVARVARYGDLTALIGFGCYDPQSICFARDNAEVLPPDALVFRTGGYDGQFYYYLAAELYRGSGSEYRARLDAAEFRRARIGYPLLVFATAFGGPRALVYGMVAIPVLLHLAVVCLLLRRAHRGSEDPARARSPRLALVVFALNPVSLFCFLYALADGLSLSLTMLAFLCIVEAWEGRARLPLFLLAVGSVGLALALVTKEHALAGAAGLLFAGFWPPLRAAISGRSRPDRRWFLDGLWLALPAVFAGLVLVSWWRWIGFHPGQAAARGSLPMSGLLEYLSGGPDAFFSGRTYLIFLFCAWALILIALSLEERSRPGNSFAPARIWRGLAVGTLAANLVLVSFATADEYWGNFANILRLFTPGFGALLCAAFAGEAVLEAASRAAGLLRFGMWVGAFASAALVFAILENEIAGRLLPVFVLGVGGFSSGF